MANSSYIEEEALIIHHYGEMPEVGYHGSLHFLTADAEGPCLTLNAAERRRLKLAVVEGYWRIIARDLEPANRRERFYRGLARCAVNWQRLTLFCRREGLAVEELRREAAGRLRQLLALELAEGCSGNCTAEALGQFARAVGLAEAEMPVGWRGICVPGGE